MNVMTVRQMATAAAVAVLAVTVMGSAATTGSAAGHQQTGFSQATKEWKAKPANANVVLATKEWKAVARATKEW